MNITQLWRSHRVLFLVFLVALSLTGFFLVRTVVFTLHWANPAHQEQTIEGWMPIRYVARSWNVPPEVLTEALELSAADRARVTVAEIAAERSESVEEIAARLRTAIADYRADLDD
ncbi:MAG: hypothetical protein MEQ84_13450 [Mesorhizobium sp.]|nr:hypothetical protein [Mesorhizobium sp.]